ncbi:DUF169 domain-containing protein [Methanolobus sp. ZRKC3]|uniref:DUF169 domain-containing protein n=1 Tax=Methanolobus sp. ZRKC3 TaxID=3125786 RepID=UPI0032452257
MEVKEINDCGQELIDRLQLKTSPVGIKLVPVGEEVPEGIEKVGENMRHCQMIDMVRRTGEAIYSLGDDQMCKGGAASMGLGEMPKKVGSGEFYYKGLDHFSNINAARRTVENAPMLPPNSIEAILYGAMDSITFEPDVAVIICNPKQVMLLTQAIMYKSGGRLEVGFAGKQSVCSDGVVQAYRDGKIGITVGCSGSRAYTEIADEEMTIGIPVEMLPDVMSGLEKICPN